MTRVDLGWIEIGGKRVAVLGVGLVGYGSFGVVDSTDIQHTRPGCERSVVDVGDSRLVLPAPALTPGVSRPDLELAGGDDSDPPSQLLDYLQYFLDSEFGSGVQYH